MAKSNTRITADKDEVALYTYEYTATSGQTTFSGSDDNGNTLDYTVDSLTVSYGGLELPVSDYIASSGTSIVLTDGAVAGEIIRVVAYEPFVVADVSTELQGEVFWENGTTVTADYTITTNKNAMSAGPITINDGVTVTVPTGSTWTVV
jgi:hypothetical protein